MGPGRARTCPHRFPEFAGNVRFDMIFLPKLPVFPDGRVARLGKSQLALIFFKGAVSDSGTTS